MFTIYCKLLIYPNYQLICPCLVAVMVGVMIQCLAKPLRHSSCGKWIYPSLGWISHWQDQVPKGPVFPWKGISHKSCLKKDLLIFLLLKRGEKGKILPREHFFLFYLIYPEGILKLPSNYSNMMQIGKEMLWFHPTMAFTYNQVRHKLLKEIRDWIHLWFVNYVFQPVALTVKVITSAWKKKKNYNMKVWTGSNKIILMVLLR